MRIRVALFLLLILSSLPVLAQSKAERIKEQLAAINTMEDVEAFKVLDTTLVCDVSTLSSGAKGFEKFEPYSAGDILTSQDKNVTMFYKVLAQSAVNQFRVQYIYFDITKLSLSKINNLRKSITKKLSNGESFDALAAQYSMDNNAANNGNLQWTEGEMVSEFEQAIRQHKTGEVFSVDIPEYKWFYLVKKTYEPTVAKTVTVFFVRVDE